MSADVSKGEIEKTMYVRHVLGSLRTDSDGAEQRCADTMVCDDCSRKLSTLATPDPYKGAATGAGGPSRSVGENKALRKGVRSNPYGNCCKVCKMKVQIISATYCTQCAYGKGVCAICGKQVLDTSMYKMSEGLAMHKVSNRDEAAFKSAEQLAREGAQQGLLEYLSTTGQVGRMPTRVALEAAGKKELADALVASYGGLHHAADAMGLSKRLLNEEAEERKQAKRQQAQQAAEQAQQAAENQQEVAAAHGEGGSASSSSLRTEDIDLPPGIALPAAVQPPAEPPSAAEAPAPATAVPPPPPARSTDSRWQYNPNDGLCECHIRPEAPEASRSPACDTEQPSRLDPRLSRDLSARCVRIVSTVADFQLSTQCYFDADKMMYYSGGVWSYEKDPGKR